MNNSYTVRIVLEPDPTYQDPIEIYNVIEHEMKDGWLHMLQEYAEETHIKEERINTYSIKTI